MRPGSRIWLHNLLMLLGQTPGKTTLDEIEQREGMLIEVEKLEALLVDGSHTVLVCGAGGAATRIAQAAIAFEESERRILIAENTAAFLSKDHPAFAKFMLAEYPEPAPVRVRPNDVDPWQRQGKRKMPRPR